MKRFAIMSALAGIIAVGIVLAYSGAQRPVLAATDGKTVFLSNCQSCHQANGQGLPGTFPPLAKNPYVTGDATRLIHTVKNGLSGPIKVNGQTYNGQMPAWKSQLSSAEIAAVLTYVRSSWGNKASAITAAQVAKVK